MAGTTRAGRAAEIRVLLYGVTRALLRDVLAEDEGWDEHGKVTEVDAIRGYVEALGGTVDVVARVGDWTVKVA
jgi:hypothetical protein